MANSDWFSWQQARLGRVHNLLKLVASSENLVWHSLTYNSVPLTFLDQQETILIFLVAGSVVTNVYSLFFCLVLMVASPIVTNYQLVFLEVHSVVPNSNNWFSLKQARFRRVYNLIQLVASPGKSKLLMT